MWIIYTIIYSLLIGIYEIFKKKAVLKSSIYEFLFYFSLISFIIVLIFSENVFDLNIIYLLIIFLKSIIIVISWLLNTYVIMKMDLGLYGITKLSRIVFSVLLSVIFLKEIITFKIFIGILVVLLGLFLSNTLSDKSMGREKSIKLVLLFLFSCLLSSISAIIDKKILYDITESQLQFWFMFFLTICYFIIFVIKQQTNNIKETLSNYWIILAAILLTVGDRLLFVANSNPDSKVSIMTILKQLSTIELLILGKIMFKENNILKKLACLSLIFIGIIIIFI